MKKRVFLLLAVLVALTACSHDVEIPAVNQDSDACSPYTAQETLVLALNALKEADASTFNKYIVYPESKKGLIVYEDNVLFGDNLDGDSLEYVQSIVEHMAFEIGDVREEGNNATIQVKITNRDLSNVYSELTKHADADNPLIAAINDADASPITFGVVVTLEKDADGWKIKMDEFFKEAVSGGAW